VSALLNTGSAKYFEVYLGKEASPVKMEYVTAADAAKSVRSLRLSTMPNTALCTRRVDIDLGTVFTTKIVEDRDESETDKIAIQAVYATVR